MSTDLDVLNPEHNPLAKIITLRQISPRDCITWIEDLNGQNEQVECPHTRRMVLNGIYYGEQIIPQGTVITGAVHLFEHFFMLLSGRMTLFTEDGLSYHEAPEILACRAGIKRIGYAHTDCVVANIERVPEGTECDADRLWELLYVGTFADYETYLNSLEGGVCH